MSDALKTYVECFAERWVVTCSECEWWHETYDSSNAATDAADWHDVEVHGALAASEQA